MRMNYVSRILGALTIVFALSSCSGKDDSEPNVPREVKVTDVTIDKETLSLVEGTSETLTIKVRPLDATDQDVTWASDNTGVATVDANGKVTAVKAGTTNVTATAKDGSGKSATCKVTVTKKAVPVTGVTLDPETKELVEGDSFTLKAVIAPEDATNTNVSWSTSNGNIATVDGTGKVTAVKEGVATITVTTEDKRKKATCKVTVTKKPIAVTAVALDPTTKDMEVGDSFNPKVTFTPEDATNKKVTWKSSNNAIATVDESGKVRAVAVGDATITVTSEDGNKTATCKVSVKAKYYKVVRVTLNMTKHAIKIGETVQLTATVAPANASKPEVSWKSDNVNVATVDDKGVVKAVALGKANITATAIADNVVSIPCEISVISDDELLFEDAAFKKYLIETAKVDTNNDGRITQAEGEAIKGLTGITGSIVSLKGIEYFTNLETFEMSGSEVKVLDLSKNKKLVSVKVKDSNKVMTEINLAGLSALKALDLNIKETSGATITMEGCDNLESVIFESSIVPIPAFGTSSLKTLDLISAPTLGSLDFTKMPKLEVLNLRSTSGKTQNITTKTINLNSCPELKEAVINGYLALETLEVSALTKLTTLNLRTVGMKAIDCSKLPTSVKTFLVGTYKTEPELQKIESLVNLEKLTIYPISNETLDMVKLDKLTRIDIMNAGKLKTIYLKTGSTTKVGGMGASYVTVEYK